MSEDSYEDRPSMEEILRDGSEKTVKRWWPKMSRRDRQRILTDRVMILRRWVSDLTREHIPTDDDVPEDAEQLHTWEASDRPDVKRWLRRLRATMKAMPEGVWVLGTDGELIVYADSSTGEPFEVDSDLMIDGVEGRVRVQW